MRICAELVGASAPFVEGLVAALGEHDLLWYSEHQSAPSPAGGGVRYQDENAATMLTILDAAMLLAVGVGACGSIAAAHYGWLRAQGKRARLMTQRRGSIWHVVVKTPAGIWDPTQLASMPGRAAIAGVRRKGPDDYRFRSGGRGRGTGPVEMGSEYLLQEGS